MKRYWPRLAALVRGSRVRYRLQIVHEFAAGEQRLQVASVEERPGETIMWLRLEKGGQE